MGAQGCQVFTEVHFSIRPLSAFFAIMNFAKVILAALLSFIVTNLMGCGCDTEKLNKCLTGLGANLGDCTKYSGCFKDEGCCDAEAKDSSGKTAKGKDITAALCKLNEAASKKGTDACA